METIKMPSYHWGYFTLCLVALQFAFVSGYPPLPSKFYQYGRGLMLETWLSSTEYAFDDFKNIPNFPNCPTYASNLDTFQYKKEYTVKQHNRFRAYFVSPQDGKHKFSVLANNKVRILIEINPGGFKNILETSSNSAANWANRKWTSEVELKKGFRYLLVVYHYGNGVNPDHLYLGVHFPDNTEVQPLDSRYLWRSMEFYKWNGLLGQKYASVSMPSDRKMSTFYSLNSAKYPDKPMEFTCGPSFYEANQHVDDYYAMLFIGYMKPNISGDYTFRMYCDDICELFLTKNNVDKSYGTANQSLPKVEFNIGQLQKDRLYHVRAARVEVIGRDYIQVEHKHDGGSYSNYWDGLLQNLEINETAVSLSPPTPVMINSTAINATLTSHPYIPPRDNWTYVEKYDMLYFETNNPTPSVVKFEFTGSMPRTIQGANLKKHTDYTFFAHYYGYINGTIGHHIITRGIVMKTDEDSKNFRGSIIVIILGEPGAPPIGVITSPMSSIAVNVTWSDIIPSKTYGIITSYSVKYKRTDGRGIEKDVIVFEKSALISGLDKYVEYDIKVAGMTSKGVGVYSIIKKQITLEDVPGKPPASISGSPETSTSIRMTWDDVPLEFRYGIIRSYNIYFKKASNNTWGKPITTTSRTYYITGLQYWTYYDVKISASTNPGEGAISSVVKVRTAEHSPTAAPPSFMEYEVTDAKILLRWDAIPAQYRNGILTGYSIMLRKKGLQSWQEIKVPAGKTSWAVDGLSQTTAYEFKIAGKTVVGLGNYTDVMVVITDVGQLIEVMPTAYFTSLDFTDKVLTKHISKTVQVTTIEQCFRACLDCMKPNSGCSCSSFNIKRPVSPSTSFSCEINASDHDDCPFDFVKETGYQYYQIL